LAQEYPQFEEMESLFQPGSVAVVGASPNINTPHGKAFKSIQENGYQGKIYAVNPNYKDINGIECYATLLDIPGPVDMAVIGVAADRTMPILRECAEKGVKSVVILTSGFSEAHAQGKNVEAEMASLAKKSGMRILGPNCVGLINNFNGLWATFAASQPDVSVEFPHAFDLISQSGFFGVAIYQMIMEHGIGFARYASIGNQADLTFSDVLNYLVHDKKTKIIGGYIEGLKDGQKFLQVARCALEREKIVLAMKVGRTEAGARAALSHTGSLAGSDRLYDALFRQTGVIRIDDIEQLVAFLLLAVPGRRPKGRRVAVVSVSGGGAVILTDKCAHFGLEIAKLEAKTREAMDSVLPSFASSANPIDVTSQAITEPEILSRCLEAAALDPNVDTVILSFHMQYMMSKGIIRDILNVYKKVDKPFLFVGRLFGPAQEVACLENEIFKAGIPIIKDVNHAIWALSSLVNWDERVREYKHSFCFPRTGTQRQPLKLPYESKILTEHKAMDVLKHYDIPCVPGEITVTVGEAILAAERVGYPVALKIQSPDILHKSDVGGLRLNIANEQELRVSFADLTEQISRNQPNSLIEGVLLQKMAPKGQEIIIGMKRDPNLGPVVMFGLGGVFTEVLEDVSFKIAPLTRYDAEEMLKEINGKKILEGYRGGAAVDKKAIVKALLRISEMAMANEKILEADINPFIVYDRGQGGVAADSIIILAD